MNSKNNGPVLLFKTIFRHWNCFSSLTATVAKTKVDWNVKKIGPIFQIMLWLQQNTPKMINVWASWWNLFYTFFLPLQEDFWVFLVKALSNDRHRIDPTNNILVYKPSLKTFIFLTGNLPKPPEMGNGNLSCIDFIWNKICQVSCKTGFVPEKPHAQSYIYSKSTGTWTTWPAGGEFPWAPCVKRKSNWRPI